MGNILKTVKIKNGMGIALEIAEQLSFDQIMAPGRKKTQKIPALIF
jgi:hypothetical protein